MRDANEREEQFRKRIQPNNNNNTDTPKEIQPTLSTVSSASSLSFHTPAIDQSPIIVPPIEDKPPIITPPENLKPIETINITPKEPIIRHTATEETTQAEYRPGIKLVPSNVLKSTIQNYMMDHNLLDENQGNQFSINSSFYYFSLN